MKKTIKLRKVNQFKRHTAAMLIVATSFGFISVPDASAQVTFFDFASEVENALATVEPPERPAAIKTMRLDVTAYTSHPNQTDGSPFITADGSVVGDGVMATNVLPFGTKVRIPSLFGDKIFEVHDRMNARYPYRVDVWMEDVQIAKNFGRERAVQIEVIEMGNGKKNWDQWKNRAADLRKIGKQGPPADALPQPYLAKMENEG